MTCEKKFCIEMIILPQWRSQQGSKIEGTVSAHSRFLFLFFHSFFSPVLYPSSFSLRPLLSVTPKSISRMPAGAMWASGYKSIFGILSPGNVSGGNGSGSFCRTRMLIWTKNPQRWVLLAIFFSKFPAGYHFLPVAMWPQIQQRGILESRGSPFPANLITYIFFL